MDKQMIEEMEKDIDFRMTMAKCVAGSMNNGVEGWLGKYLIEKGWIKPAENAVVLTREEYKKLKHGSGTLEQLYNQYPYRVLVGFNSMVFSQDRECYEKLYDEIEEKARKETAEKFAERLKEINCEAYLKKQLHLCIDEIAKEFTEGKV